MGGGQRLAAISMLISGSLAITITSQVDCTSHYTERTMPISGDGLAEIQSGKQVE